MKKITIIILMILSLFTACGIKDYKQNIVSHDDDDVPKTTENSINTSDNTSIQEFEKSSSTNEKSTKITMDISNQEYNKKEVTNEFFLNITLVLIRLS